MWGVEIAVMLCMIAFNGVFAAYEIALASISLARLQVLDQEHRAGAGAALRMKGEMEWSLAVVQLGITLMGAIAAATAGAGAEEQISPQLEAQLGVSSAVAEALGIALVVIPLTFAMIIFGELIPKAFALRNQEWVTLRLSPAMEWFATLVWPVVWFLESSVSFLVSLGERLWLGRLEHHRKQGAFELQELKASAAIARMSRFIGHQEEKIILGAADLSRRPVQEVMLPVEFISLLDAKSTVSDALIAAHMDMHTRFPVTEVAGDPQRIVGYVTFKDIVAHLRFFPHEPTLRPIIRRIASLPADMSVAECLERLIREHAHIALIGDREGRVVGMVTMEDILEELVGDILDEYDKLPTHMVPTGKGWIVGGGLSLQAVREKTGIHLQAETTESNVRTLSKWIERRLDGPIHGAEVVSLPQARVVVRKCRRHKVMEAYLEPTEPARTS